VKRACLVLSLAIGSAGPGIAQVSADRLVNATADLGSWLTYSGDYQSRRFSPLRQITPLNARRLRPIWVYQAGDPGDLQTTPIVADGVMYLTEGHSHVVAPDLRTGSTLWRRHSRLHHLRRNRRGPVFRAPPTG
jgi:glucose dehydrogenase